MSLGIADSFQYLSFSRVFFFFLNLYNFETNDSDNNLISFVSKLISQKILIKY